MALLSYERWFVSLHRAVYCCIIDQTKLQIFMEGVDNMFCPKLGGVCRSFYVKEGREALKGKPHGNL